VRPRRRWEDVIKMVHKGTWCEDVNRSHVHDDRSKWRFSFETVTRRV
jgi:hypothetical protein